MSSKALFDRYEEERLKTIQDFSTEDKATIIISKYRSEPTEHRKLVTKMVDEPTVDRLLESGVNLNDLIMAIAQYGTFK